jgi:ribosomal protein S27E
VALTVAQQEQVLQTIKDRIGGDIKCPLCGRTAWMFTDGVAVIHAQETLANSAVPDQGLPALPLVCRQCGNTHFLNVFALGLSHLFQKSGGS